MSYIPVIPFFNKKIKKTFDETNKIESLYKEINELQEEVIRSKEEFYTLVSLLKHFIENNIDGKYILVSLDEPHIFYDLKEIEEAKIEKIRLNETETLNELFIQLNNLDRR